MFFRLFEDASKSLSLRMDPKNNFPSFVINTLSLMGEKLTARDVPQVFQLLSPEVRILKLAANQLGAEGATVLADMLKTNSTLTTIHLAVNQIKDEGATALADMLKTNSSLTTINLQMNQIKESGATALADTLKTNSSLTKIYLDNNPVGKWGGEALYASIAHNDHLEGLRIDSEWIPSEFIDMSLDQVRSFTTALEHG